LTRIILAKPKVLLLDEPTAHLDQDSEARVLQAIMQAIGTDCTLVFVTHKIQILGLVHRLIVMGKGQIVIDGPKAEVLEKLRPSQSPPSAAGRRIIVKGPNDV
jgi:ATP-binding cassette subfamily C protein LapB